MRRGGRARSVDDQTTCGQPVAKLSLPRTQADAAALLGDPSDFAGADLEVFAELEDSDEEEEEEEEDSDEDEDVEDSFDESLDVDDDEDDSLDPDFPASARLSVR
jgi:hypothetical protein